MPDNNNSNTRITKLSPLLINQLAAGEVVTRPSAVVKELLENAIDAGATSIEVRITQGGMGMIEVVDNGVGIHPDDMVMAITRHATSKVADIANLHGISTLGFRGEALAATAAVARLTLTSSHDDSGIGRQLQVAGVLADTPTLTPVVHTQGTTITVKDLYFNVPARRGNLKSIGTEFTHIETIVREVALARADVTLSLYHDQKKRLTLSATSIGSPVGNAVDSNDSYLPLSRLEQALGLSLTDNALEVMVDLSSLSHDSNASAGYSDKQATISGWLWPVITNQTNQTSQPSSPKLLYVNGRLVKEALISNQLRQLASSAQLDGIGYALYFELPNHWLNVNVHPTKQRIKISPLNNIMAHLSHFIGLKLKSINIPKSLTRATSSKQGSDENYLFKNEDSRQQVHAPQSQYQLSDTNQSTKKRSIKLSDFSTNNISSGQRVEAANASPKVTINTNNSIITDTATVTSVDLPLPYCLDVISDLSKSHQTTSASIIESDNLSPLPWLLFYSQGQCLLINEQNWQESWLEASEAKPYAPVLDEEPFSKQKLSKQKDKPVSAAMINQKINSYTAQISVQQLAGFKVTLEQALSNNAHSIINTEQLLKVMLSSALS
ncbi:DNA mismatch repair endonuclease MutL [Psychrobacter sp. LV10R520-6]|uniref:DNA mismatch repair endonuclease MutL n=1 Tax=Psychrobacter sp. LV10R520-6 TaxID=1415574 RepID=UPI0024CD843E|nr:DNA mismatch repair endonuclease MutL [Psychrobacter sp. LV10R520-6]SNT69706.1 DNA mismatch repair protein MutL [Psychrobacter sp. LV10R520-6]